MKEQTAKEYLRIIELYRILKPEFKKKNKECTQENCILEIQKEFPHLSFDAIHRIIYDKKKKRIAEEILKMAQSLNPEP